MKHKLTQKRDQISLMTIWSIYLKLKPDFDKAVNDTKEVLKDIAQDLEVDLPESLDQIKVHKHGEEVILEFIEGDKSETQSKK